MVATSGAGWKLAPCLIALEAETDALYPSRSIAYEGSIGDASHQTRVSDHNPAPDGYVYAVDVTDDDMHGCDVDTLRQRLVARKDKRVKYLIRSGLIWRSYDKPGLPAWTPEPYTGPNPHDHHMHISVLADQRDTPGAWWAPVPAPTPTPIAPSSEEDAPMLYKDPNRGTFLLSGGKAELIRSGSSLTEIKTALKDPSHVAELVQADADGFHDRYAT